MRVKPRLGRFGRQIGVSSPIGLADTSDTYTAQDVRETLRKLAKTVSLFMSLFEFTNMLGNANGHVYEARPITPRRNGYFIDEVKEWLARTRGAA